MLPKPHRIPLLQYLEQLGRELYCDLNMLNRQQMPRRRFLKYTGLVLDQY